MMLMVMGSLIDLGSLQPTGDMTSVIMDTMDLNDLEYVGLNAEFQCEETMNPNEKTDDIKYYEIIVGIKFDSIDEAYSQYKAFIFCNGFCVTKIGRTFTSEEKLRIEAATEEAS
ncbi:hypothetical protein QJS10_CPB11g00868 [Acorus calamus]|uniref:Uncharacterized protein n=1 Tax=Acorus calamus TaxID=4465 RepID=A0AAV9DSM2_ACOCL|nr:hypothetical protein QJS10_CPB11g00868 [Acorus calamus]